jgi:ribosomal protein L31
MQKGDRVEVLPIKEQGKIVNIRVDSSNHPIYTVEIDQPTKVADGIMVARVFELRSLEDDANQK